jgi:hypothetical protein
MDDLTIGNIIKDIKRFKSQDNMIPESPGIADDDKSEFLIARNKLMKGNGVMALLESTIRDLEAIEEYSRGENILEGRNHKTKSALNVHVLGPASRDPLERDIEFAYEWTLGVSELQQRVCLQALSENLSDMGYGPIALPEGIDYEQ